MKNVRILIVDDDPIIAELVRHVLISWQEEGHWNYEIISAQDGIQGLELVKKVHPDVIILDFHLPGMNGYEVIQELKTLKNPIPVIMVTAAPLLGQVQLARAACDAYLPKPFRPSILAHQVQNQIVRQRCSMGADNLMQAREEKKISLPMT